MIDLALDNNIIVTKAIDEAIQEVDILFNTTNTELLGDTSYGTNFIQFLWELTPSPNEVKKYIQNKLETNSTYFKRFLYDIDVQTYKNNNSESIYVINMKITDTTNNEIREHQYNIR